MKFQKSCESCLCVILLLVAFTGFSDAELELSKNRRASGPSGLVAFPRVGRSDPNLSNNNNLHETDSFDSLDNLYASSLEDYEDYPKSEMKRSSLIAYPRVGRVDADVRKWARLMALEKALEKRTGPNAYSGLWFGPRLGKRSVNPNQH